MSYWQYYKKQSPTRASWAHNAALM